MCDVLHVLSSFCSKVSARATVSFTVPVCVHADQDSVRLLAVECCGPLAQLCRKDDVMTHILPVVQKFSQVQCRDPCDRCCAASRICTYMLAMCTCRVSAPSCILWNTHAMCLLQDKSWRVRYNVAQQLTTLCEALGPDLAK